MSEQLEMNDQFILISGQSTTGKSASLRNIRNQETWLYLNSEAGKRLPFQNNFFSQRIHDPLQVTNSNGFMEAAIAEPGCNGLIVDSITFLMDMFESQYVINSDNTMKGWSDYAQYFKHLTQSQVVRFARPTIFIAHTKDDYDEKNMETKTSVPIKGSLKNNGIESYFSTVVSTKRMALKDLEPYINPEKNPLLNITEEEEELGFKYVFQTRLTSKTTGERIRSPMGMFTKEQTFMDNDAQLLLDHLNRYYGTE